MRAREYIHTPASTSRVFDKKFSRSLPRMGCGRLGT
nr:MAG TPA: hypothetical protein [Caudoviricetes sp.]